MVGLRRWGFVCHEGSSGLSCSYIRLLMGMQRRVMIKVTMMLIILIRVMVTMLEMMKVFVNINSSHISESFIVEDKGLLLVA